MLQMSFLVLDYTGPFVVLFLAAAALVPVMPLVIGRARFAKSVPVKPAPNSQIRP